MWLPNIIRVLPLFVAVQAQPRITDEPLEWGDYEYDYLWNNRTRMPTVRPADEHKIQLGWQEDVGYVERGSRANEEQFKRDLTSGLRKCVDDAMTLAAAARYGQRRMLDTFSEAIGISPDGKSIQILLESVESPPNSNRFVAMWSVVLDGNLVLADYIVRDMKQYLTTEMINNNLGVAVESYDAYIAPEVYEPQRYWIILVAIGGAFAVLLLGWFCLCAYFNTCAGQPDAHAPESVGKTNQSFVDAEAGKSDHVGKPGPSGNKVIKVTDHDAQTTLTGADRLDDLNDLTDLRTVNTDTAALYATILKHQQRDQMTDQIAEWRSRPSRKPEVAGSIPEASSSGGPGIEEGDEQMTADEADAATDRTTPIKSSLSKKSKSEMDAYRQSVKSLIDDGLIEDRHKLGDEVEVLRHDTVYAPYFHMTGTQPRPAAPSINGEQILGASTLLYQPPAPLNRSSLMRLYVDSLSKVITAGNAHHISN